MALASHPRVLHIGVTQTLDSVVREQLLGLRERGWDCVLACSEDGWERRLSADGFSIRPIRMGARPGLRRMAVGGADITRLLRRERFSLIHTHNAHHGLLGRIAAALHRTPSVHTWRYSPLDATSSRALQVAFGAAEGTASRLGLAVLFQNGEDMEEAVRHRLVPASRAELIGNGIRIERYEAPSRPRDEVRDTLDIPRDAEVIICVARLEERKGQRTLIDALVRLGATRPGIHLLLVGGGSDEPVLRGRVDRLGLGRRVSFLGQRDDVVDLLHASDVLCLASRREGVPRAVMEAMAARVPVVATDVVGSRSVVRDGRTGLLAPFGDAERLADELGRVLGSHRLAERLTVNAHHALRHDWNEETVTGRVDHVYRRLLAA